MCFRETSFTALQQGDINDLLRVSVPVQINRVIIIEVDQAHNDRKMVDTSTGGRHQGEIRMIPLSCLMIVNYPTNSSTSNNGRWDMEVQRKHIC